MNNKAVYILVATCCIALLCYGCRRQKQEAYTPPPNTISINGSVHEMTLYPETPPDFPEHEGKAEFVSYCAICHTLKYVTMQPDFPAKTWNAEVDKMVHKYNAPIDSVTCKKIVAYLVAVKGKK